MSRHYLENFIENLGTFSMKLYFIRSTRISISMTAVSFWKEANHIGDVWTLNIKFIKHLLSNKVKFIWKDPPVNSNRIIALLADNSVCHFSKPPNSYVKSILPFLYHWFLTEKIDKLINLKLLYYSKKLNIGQRHSSFTINKKGDQFANL